MAGLKGLDLLKAGFQFLLSHFKGFICGSSFEKNIWKTLSHFQKLNIFFCKAEEPIELSWFRLYFFKGFTCDCPLEEFCMNFNLALFKKKKNIFFCKLAIFELSLQFQKMFSSSACLENETSCSARGQWTAMTSLNLHLLSSISPSENDLSRHWCKRKSSQSPERRFTSQYFYNIFIIRKFSKGIFISEFPPN